MRKFVVTVTLFCGQSPRRASVQCWSLTSPCVSMSVTMTRIVQIMPSVVTQDAARSVLPQMLQVGGQWLSPACTYVVGLYRMLSVDLSSGQLSGQWIMGETGSIDILEEILNN